MNNQENIQLPFNFRLTTQRKIILEELKKVKSHPSADQVYEMVKQRIPRISLGTVYRNLNVLAEMGMIQALEFGSIQKRFDGDPDTHYHILCINCGRVDDIPGKNIPAIEKDLLGKPDWEITRQRLKFFGICPQCREKRNQSG